MIIAQTFWSSGKSLTESGFGWLHPEYNIMSWALSCLCLKEFYDNVVLYTDSEACRILIDKLHLPYTEVFVKYDDFACLPQHWAYAKVMTYSLQAEPFLHIDGDVFLPRVLDEKINNSELVAQNRETGTGYYKCMAEKLLCRNSLFFQPYLYKALLADSIPSYNAGIFGGNDLSFIHHYCEEVFRFFNENKLNIHGSMNENLNCNVIFEQVLFAALADIEGRGVKTVIDDHINDVGYTFDDFCDLHKFSSRSLFHIIGGHKQNRNICLMLERTLLERYPEIYKRIIKLFPTRHPGYTKCDLQADYTLDVQMCMAQYYDFYNRVSRYLSLLDSDELLDIECRKYKYFEFVNAHEVERSEYCIFLNPHVFVYHIPEEWHPDAVNLLASRLGENGNRHFDVVVIPSVTSCPLKELAIGDMAYNIMTVLSRKTKYREIVDFIKRNVLINNKSVSKNIDDCILREIEFLLYNGIVFIKNI